MFQIRKLDEKLSQEMEAAKLEAKRKEETKENQRVKWTEEELQLLVKAATLFPVGTKSR